jgi:quercetin dioxygenase-like cupin family protein
MVRDSASARRDSVKPTPSLTAVPPTRQVVALGPGHGERFWFLDQLVVVKLRGEGAPYGVLETELESGRATPFHRHLDEDEGFYVLQGELSLYVEGGRILHGSPGSYLHVPRGVAHGFRTHTRTRLLVLSAPLGFVDFTREYGEPAPSSALPPLATPDLPRLQGTARKYQIELLGPLPEIA